MARKQKNRQLRRVRRNLWIGGIVGFIWASQSATVDLFTLVAGTGVGLIFAATFTFFTETS